MHRYFFILILLFSCGKKEVSDGCTSQNTSSNTILISCKTKRFENPSTCARTPIDQSSSQQEICQLGFDINCAPAKVIPSSVKTNVQNGSLVLINKSSGKRLRFTEITSGLDVYLLLQQEGDVGLTSSVDLPICPN